jgi:hypothetical protein
MVTRNFFHWACTSLAQKARFFGSDAPKLIQDSSVSKALFNHIQTQIELSHQEWQKQSKTSEGSEDPPQKKQRNNKRREAKKKAKKAAKRAARKARKGKKGVLSVNNFIFLSSQN